MKQSNRLSRDKIRITITGGEPTIDPNLNYILSSLLDKDNKTIHISVITNLSRSHNYFENFVEQFGERNNHISFVASYHIENANESNFIRNLEILSSGGFRVFAWILAHPLFMDEVKRIYNRIKDLNLKNTRVVPKAIRDEFGRSAFPDNRYKIEDLKWLNQFADDGEILFMDTYDQNLGRVTRKFYNLNEAITLKINKFKGMLCNAGINMISIDENGFVSPAVCLRSSSKNFNIFEDENALEKVKGPIVCPFDACKCLADLPLLKYTNDYEAKGINRSNASREEPYKHPLINALQTKGWEYKKDLYLEHFDYVLKLKETSSPSISVIVISWRLHEDTVKNFQILNKQRNQNFELIFVDNGGKEREFELLKPYVDIYIRLKNNTGAYLARNIGSVFASAPILLFLEDDGIPESNLIKSHLDIHKKYDVIAVRGVYKPKTSNVLNRYAAHYFLGDKPFPYPSNLEGNSSYRADIFYKVGGWNDEIFFGHGGKELAIRLLRIENDPRKQIYSPEPIIYHDFATDNAHLAKKIRKQQESLSDLKKKYPEWDTIISTWKKFFARHDQLIPKIILDERQEKSINYHSHLLKALSYYEHGETDMAKNHLLSLITELKEIAR
ncbi:MAG: glycosyltransferase [Syntrophales bacterium]|nr:glycosyltransferase [Syntrophales bacterium]